MRSKLIRLRRSANWYAERCIRIGRKVAWRVLGFASPKAYREFRDERIRHERAAGRFSATAHRESATAQRWFWAQPVEYQRQSYGSKFANRGDR